MPSSKKVKLVSHGSTSGTTKKPAKRALEKDAERLNKLNASINKNTHELLAKWPAKEYLERKLDETGVDNDPGIDVPLHARGGDWKWNFEEKPMSLTDKVTWVLTAVNVAILISLVIKNV